MELTVHDFSSSVEKEQERERGEETEQVTNRFQGIPRKLEASFGLQISVLKGLRD